MADVFGGLTGGPGDERPGRDARLAALEPVLEGAALWGMELEPRFRVLAATVEPRPDRYPWGANDDRRIQVLCFPVSTILASLREQDTGSSAGARSEDQPEERSDGWPEERPEEAGARLLAFTEEQLVDVVAALDGPAMHGPLFAQPEPRRDQWGPGFSLEGRSTAPDGTRTTLTVSVRRDALSLDLFARFDDVELRGPDGEQLPWP